LKSRIPTPLAAFWLVYMAGMGVFFPYFSLYLGDPVHGLGLSGTQVGLVVSMIPVAALCCQPLWGQLADRSGHRRGVLITLALGTGVCYAILGRLESFHAVLVGTFALAAFQSSVLPVITSLSLAVVGRERFGLVRLWGTVGFLALVVAFPPWLAGRGGDLSSLFPLAAGLSLTAMVVALTLPRGGEVALRSQRGEVWRLLRHPPVLRLVLLLFAAQLCMQGPIHLFPLYLTARGGDAAVLGKMWVFMLLLEIPLIAFSGQTLRRLGPRGLLTAGLLAEGVRWSTCALSSNLAWIQGVQLLHGVGVAGVLVGGPLYLEHAVPPRLRSTGQTLLAAAGTGAGAIVSTAAAGWLIEHVGPAAPYTVAGVGALALAAVLYGVLPEPSQPDGQREGRSNAPPEIGGFPAET